MEYVLRQEEHKDSLSPYVLQHASNPIAWQKWGKDAFSLAKKRRVPIFLSIGYSSCHWCHVMEREAFSDENVARLLHRMAVPIKLDREEYPEIDMLYIQEAQKRGIRSLGWPFNIFLDCYGRFLFSCTYLPTQEFISLLEQFERWWNENGKEEIESSSPPRSFSCPSPITHNVLAPSSHQQKEVVERFFNVIAVLSDKQWGGLGDEPKFPISFLAQCLINHGSPSLQAFAFSTLLYMGRGGLFDQINGGFFRYTIDRGWCIPHFEKMLYDNALLLDAYSEAYIKSQQSEFLNIAKKTANFCLSHMALPQYSLFAGSLDADSKDGVEGAAYCYTKEEIDTALCLLCREGDMANKKDALLSYFGFDIGPLIQSHGKKGARFLPMRPYGETTTLSQDDIVAFQDTLQKLHAAENITVPFRNEAIKTGWNSLIIHSLVTAGDRLDCQEWVKFAEKSMNSLLSMAYKGDCLLRYGIDGVFRLEACFDDYSYTVRALLTLFISTGKSTFLSHAVTLFWIAEKKLYHEGRYHFSVDHDDDPVSLSFHEVQHIDGQEPSALFIHIENASRLSFLFFFDTSYSVIVDRFIQTDFLIRKNNELLSSSYAVKAVLENEKRQQSQKVLWCIVKNEEERHEISQFLKADFHESTPTIVMTIEERRKLPYEQYSHLPMVLEETVLLQCTASSCLLPINGFENVLQFFRMLSQNKG